MAERAPSQESELTQPDIDGPLLEEALRRCESEPIHRLGQIQPQGVLFAVEGEDFVITQVSANLLRLFPFQAAEVIGAPLARVIGAEAVESLRKINGLGEWRPSAVVRFAAAFGSAMRVLTAQVSRLERQCLVEIELPSTDDSPDLQQLFQPIRDALWRLDAEKDLGRYLQVVADQVRVLTGFDRVLIYRFDVNWDGEVIAESGAEGMPSLLAHRFPASDIPPQARRLYTRSTIRMVANTEDQLVPLLPAGPALGDSPTDLTYSTLRGLSPVHLQYLRNMGIRASLSISLLQGERLWGLVACHHRQPRYLSLQAREFLEFIGKMVSVKLATEERAYKVHANQRVMALLERLPHALQQSAQLGEIVAGLGGEVLDLMQAAGACIRFGEQVVRWGQTPDEGGLAAIEAWLQENGQGRLFHSHRFGAQCPPAAAWHEVASGIVHIPFGAGRQASISWFRPEVLRTINWAGALDKALSSDRDGALLTPRKSFATWVENVRATSLEWTSSDLHTAEALAMVLAHSLASAREDEGWMVELLQHSADLVCKLDPAGRILATSAAARAIFGQSREAMRERNIVEFIDGESRSAFLNAIALLEQEQRPQTLILRAAAREGGSRWIECLLNPLLEQGSGAIILNARDITDRYSYQLALEEMRQRDVLWNQLPRPGILVVDGAEHILSANEEAAALLCSETALLQATPLSRWLTLPGEGGEAAARGGPCLVRRADGSLHALALIRAPLASGASAPRPAAAVLVLRESARSAPGDGVAEPPSATPDADAVIVTDEASRIIGCSASFAEISGYERAEILGNTPRLVRSGVHTASFYAELWATLHARGYWQGEIWNRRKSGEIYPQWGSISAHPGAAGQRLYVAVFSDISRLQQAERNLYHLANHDALTGLPNRARFNDHFANGLERARRAGSKLGLVFIDLDRFKSINDTLGHAAGDIYLKTVASRLRGALRQQDMLARWGGDEFVALLEDLQQREEATVIVRRMQEAVGVPFVVGGQEVSPTLSLGVAWFPQDAQNAADLVRAADQAMYQVKQRGRHGMAFVSSAPGRSASVIHAGHDGARCTGCREGQGALLDLSMAFQPIIDCDSATVMAYEALVRGPAGEAAATVLEQVEKLNRYAFDQACRRTAITLAVEAGLLRQGDAGLCINFLPSAVYRAEVCIRATLEIASQLDFPLGRIIFEVSEHDHARDPQHLKNIFREYQRLGFRTAIDDFGAGQNGLQFLADFQPDILKLDMALIRNIDSDPVRRAIVRGMLAVCADLGIEVIGEGVETREEFAVLRDLGIRLFQGYLFARPALRSLPTPTMVGL